MFHAGEKGLFFPLSGIPQDADVAVPPGRLLHPLPGGIAGMIIHQQDLRQHSGIMLPSQSGGQRRDVLRLVVAGNDHGHPLPGIITVFFKRSESGPSPQKSEDHKSIQQGYRQKQCLEQGREKQKTDYFIHSYRA